MRSFKLDAGQRLLVLDILGQQTGRLAQLAPYWRIMELVRIPEPEAQNLALRKEGNTIFWDPSQPSTDFQLEDADAAALRACLDIWEHFQPSQVPVAQKILQALAGSG